MATEHGGIAFPVQRLDLSWRCRPGSIVDEYTTVGTTGPVQTPLSAALYSFLLDRPVTTTTLVQRLGIGPFEATPRGVNQ